MARRLKKEEKRAVVDALVTLYKTHYANPIEFFNQFQRSIDHATSTPGTTDSEKARSTAIVNGGAKIGGILTKFLKKRRELIVEQFDKFKAKMDEIKSFLSSKDTLNSSDVTRYTVLVEELKNIFKEIGYESIRFNALVTEGVSRGLIASDSVLTTKIPRVSVPDAIALTEEAAKKALAARGTSDFNKINDNWNDINQQMITSCDSAYEYGKEQHEMYRRIGVLSSGEPTRGTRDPKPTRGTGDPEPTRGTGDPEPTRGTGDPKPTRGTGDPEPTRGTGDPEPTRGTGDPAPIGGTGDPEPAPIRPTTPTDGFRENYKLGIQIINDLIERLAEAEKEAAINHSIVASEDGINYDALEKYTELSNEAQRLDMQILTARKNLTILESEEYRKHPFYYAKFDTELAGAVIKYDKLDEFYKGKPVQEMYDEHAVEICNALGELEIYKAQHIFSGEDIDKIKALQEFIVAEKNTINRELMAYARFDNTFNMENFLNANKGKFIPKAKTSPVLEPEPEVQVNQHQ